MDEQNLDTLTAIAMGSELAATSPDVFAGIINQATDEERAGVKNAADLVSLYFTVGQRVHQRINMMLAAKGINPPVVDLSDFADVLAAAAQYEQVSEGYTLQ